MTTNSRSRWSFASRQVWTICGVSLAATAATVAVSAALGQSGSSNYAAGGAQPVAAAPEETAPPPRLSPSGWRPRGGAAPARPSSPTSSAVVPVRYDKPAAAPQPRPIKAPPVLSPVTPADLTPEQRGTLGAARAAVARGDYQQGASRFQEYLRGRPGDAAVRREYTGVLITAKQFKLAVEQFKLLLKSEPDDVDLNLGLANVYLQLDQPKEAVPYLLAALKGAPENADIATKLAQAYLGINEPHNARVIFERYLSRLKPGDADVPARFGRLLLDLNRPKTALAFLQPLLAKAPGDAELLSEMIRGKAWLGHRDEAARLVADLAVKDPRNFKLRIGTAEALYRIAEYKVAGMLFEQALQAKPSNLRAALGLARVNTQLFEVGLAARTIESCLPSRAPEELLALARGELDLAVGKYAEGIKELQCYLHHDEDDVDCRVALAKLYEVTEDYEKAKAEWTKLGLLKGQSERSMLGLAWVLAAQWRFAESNDLCQRVLAEEPESYAAVAQLVYNFGKMHKAEQSVAVAREFLSRPHEDDNGMVVVTLALTRVFLDAKRFPEAVAECKSLLGWPLGRVPATYFCLFYAESRCDAQHAGQSREVLQPVLEGGTLRDKMQLADIASGYNVNDLIIDICLGVLGKCPQHLPSLLRLAEAQLRIAVHDANIEATVATCRAILSISPTNVRGRFTLARAFALAQKYPPSIQEYMKLIKTDPDLLQARKELARTLYSANYYKSGHMDYVVAQFPTGDEVLQNALNHLGAPEAGQPAPPGANPAAVPPLAVPPRAVSPHPVLPLPLPVSKLMPTPAKPANAADAKAVAKGAKPTPEARKEHLQEILSAAVQPAAVSANKGTVDLILASAKESALPDTLLPAHQAAPAKAAPEPEPEEEPAANAVDEEMRCRRKAQRLAIEAEARSAEVKAIAQEKYAKSLKDLRNHEAVGAYTTLLQSQPDNTSAMFDLTEMYGALKLTTAAATQADQLLWVEPFNRDAAVTLEHANMALQPWVRPRFDILSQNGRNGLARIDIFQETLEGACFYGDEGDYIGAGYSRQTLIPHQGYPNLVGNIFTLLYGQQFNDSLRFISQVNYAEYPHQISSKPTYNASLIYDVSDCWQAYAGSYLENVLQNGESIAQNIYRLGGFVGSDFHITREIDASAWYRFTGYSDNNFSHNAFVRAVYRFLPPPYELKFLSSVQYLNFDQTNALSGTSTPFPQPPLQGLRHPYFAPRAFFYFEERVAYKRTLTRDLFKYSDQCWYQIEYGLGLDNRNQIYNNFALSLNYDVNSWLKISAVGQTMISRVYNAGSGTIFVEVRIPPLH